MYDMEISNLSVVRSNDPVRSESFEVITIESEETH